MVWERNPTHELWVRMTSLPARFRKAEHWSGKSPGLVAPGGSSRKVMTSRRSQKAFTK